MGSAIRRQGSGLQRISQAVLEKSHEDASNRPGSAAGRPPSAGGKEKSHTSHMSAEVKDYAEAMNLSEAQAKKVADITKKSEEESMRKLEQELTDYQHCVRFLCENETGEICSYIDEWYNACMLEALFFLFM